MEGDSRCVFPFLLGSLWAPYMNSTQAGRCKQNVVVTHLGFNLSFPQEFTGGTLKPGRNAGSFSESLLVGEVLKIQPGERFGPSSRSTRDRKLVRAASTVPDIYAQYRRSQEHTSHVPN